MRTITLEDLHIFQTVVREGGIHKAADVLNRVPSNITTRIKRFEERLGCLLFRRQGRGLVLTEAGKRLLGHADKMLRLADEVARDMTQAGVAGVLQLGSLESAAAVRLPDLLSSYHVRYPEVSVHLKTGSTGALLSMLKDHEIEAALVSEPFNADQMNALPVFQEELVLITALGHPNIRSPKDLQVDAVAAFPHGCSYRRCLLEWLGAAGVSPKRIMDLGSYHAIVASVAAGAAFGILPISVLNNAVQGSNVQQHTLPQALSVNVTHLVWQGPSSLALQGLIDLLSEARAEGE
ncbi:LysR family transcriptional regulator [Marinobacterium sediminicola]|uniref:DNA-binding transcriptional regulator, LysR family n=1 Tax=Marinobacterium sediminicola TaxID=518898 RepID=A0ABY1RXG3_9GAMM|nr:LysR family transcriptional regulator [Marinobacterium sediminicola]ULG67799.1 LysR substrate-binding domain-containing protein [Marinobacterium sediminicola]SMR71525.1 DNA-binding transcriptional regulator, LysR family [Marinobacterium sediminicola]